MNAFIGARFPGMSKYALTVAETCPNQFNRCLEMLEKGSPMSAIEKELYSVEPVVWREWLTVILGQWKKDNDRIAPFAKDRMRQVLWTTFSRAFEENDNKSALAALDKLCKLDGLYEAQKIESIVNESTSLNQAKDRLVELFQNPKVQSALSTKN